MSNNYFAGTLSPTHLKLKRMHQVFLEACQAGIDSNGDNTFYAYWETCFSEDPDEDIIKEAIAEGRITSDEAGFIASSSFEETLRDILIHNSVEALRAEFAFFSEKIRPGEFGGVSLLVTKDQYCWTGSGNSEVAPSGKIILRQLIINFDDRTG